ncbi:MULTISPECIES: N-acetylglutaminylglutamine synthetase [Micromonospora]|uniref:N-acetylglutaminylglutamine synthetase n=1 Tax=Micromonospora TaxID=1873 RepID=UPI000DEA3F7D|nr:MULTISPECIES: N-acetylglutaminylglutamine synthetase [unclassified Micromonospora]MBQ1061211.1 N-acetylglutaminylglutamine synthetase [Micromonospora sp. C41]NHO83840.1 N-acetylglutaminylglutamine synthetase [Micromonospora sp. CMU55-4]RBQ12866.1 N-acetylglutaminylglutamine synthetase [Micromonospora sp. LHW51205]WBB83889.1 N-acetylglutaminylglutamine synthetase [Micromonospora sp. WMMC264]
MTDTLATGTARTDRERVLGRRRERIGPGGDPVAPGTPEQRQPEPTSTDASGVVLDCGWGRLVFGQTFDDQVHVADVLRSEAVGARDICIYLRDPHVLVSRLPDELFIDPSLTYRLPLGEKRPAATEGGEVPGLTVRPLRDAADAEAVNRIYARNGMVTAPVEVLVDNAGTDRFLHLVAEDTTGEVVGTITGVDHVAVFGDPENGASLWCLTVDFNTAPPGTGQALLTALADRLDGRGRAFVDLSVLAENSGAIRLYERLGFHRTGTLCVKRKNPINERLFLPAMPEGYDELNPYAKIVADEAMRRGIRVEVTDPHWGELKLTTGGRTIHTRESLSELTSAVAMSRCDDKRVTRRILTEAGLSVPRGRTATGEPDDVAFLNDVGPVVVKPARGEQGNGITVGVRTPEALTAAVELARRFCPDVLIEELRAGEDLRVVVIDHEVVAAAVRRPAQITGDGVHDITELIERQSRRRAAATGGESRIPIDDMTREVVAEAGYRMHDVLPEGEVLAVRRTANLHTGGTIHDVTAELHPAIAEACVTASRALDIPVTGLDLLVPAPDRPEHVFIEANERPGLANHEPQPTAERFVDLLFPGTRAPQRLWSPAGAASSGA